MTRHTHNAINEKRKKTIAKAISDDWLFNEISILIKKIKDKHLVDEPFIISLLKKKSKHSALTEQKQQPVVPASIFQDRKLGILESLIKYLREEKAYSNAEAAKLLNRDSRVTWTTYKKASSKNPKKIVFEESPPYIPVSIFSKTNIGVLETLTVYLKEDLHYSNKQIALILNRNPRTIWASYNQAIKKLSKQPAKETK